MSSLIPFEFGSAPIRVVEIDSEPWFVGKDVAMALGYADPTNAVKQHCKGVAKHHPIVDSLGRTQQARVLNEANVLRLVINSQLPAAERFEAWVFEEVLPAIRKTGEYAVRPVGLSRSAPVAAEFEALMSIATTAGLKDNAALIAAAQGTQRLTGQNPLALIGMASLKSEVQAKLITATEIAAELGLSSAQKANALLEEKGLHVAGRSARKAKTWAPTAAGESYGRWEDTGKRHGDGTPVHQWKWAENVLDALMPAARAA